MRYRYDRTSGRVVPVGDEQARASAPCIWRDLAPYRSPVTGQWVDGRAARRDDLARTHCREVDPSERTAFVPPRGE